jgi:hypothetical protein
VASYPRQIPAGGEGTIRIKVNTNGYGGRTLKKNIEVFTNDTQNPRIALSIAGSVLAFAQMDPPYARLAGQAGTDIKAAITITRQAAFPFKILEAKARNGSDIAVEVKEFEQGGENGYIVTVVNKKNIAGRYADMLILSTDSTVKPAITVPVYGQISAAVPQPDASTPEKKAHDS